MVIAEDREAPRPAPLLLNQYIGHTLTSRISRERYHRVLVNSFLIYRSRALCLAESLARNNRSREIRLRKKQVFPYIYVYIHKSIFHMQFIEDLTIILYIYYLCNFL